MFGNINILVALFFEREQNNQNRFCEKLACRIFYCFIFFCIFQIVFFLIVV